MASIGIGIGIENPKFPSIGIGIGIEKLILQVLELVLVLTSKTFIPQASADIQNRYKNTNCNN